MGPIYGNLIQVDLINVCKSWNIAVRILLGLPFIAHVYLLGPLVGQLGMREQLYVRNFRFQWNAFRLQSHNCFHMYGYGIRQFKYLHWL